MGEKIHIFLMVISLFFAFFLAVKGLFNLENQWSKSETACCIFFGIACLCFSTYFTGRAILQKQEWKISKKSYKTEHIVKLNDTMQTSGIFFLRRGQIQEDMYYQYMFKRHDGGYSYGKVKENNAAIYESDSNYRVEWYKKQKHFLWFSEEDKFCKIYVSKESIKEDYIIDLEE